MVYGLFEAVTIVCQGAWTSSAVTIVKVIVVVLVLPERGLTRNGPSASDRR